MWSPKIVAAEAFSESHFVVAYGELDHDDPFTAVLEYDASFPQPWSRTDVAREIKSIARTERDEPGRFVVASDEGDIYFIGDTIVREKITGAGVASPDASGAGGILSLSQTVTHLLAAGQGAQVYKRSAPGRWDRVILTTIPDISLGLLTLTAIKAGSEHDIYILGFSSPQVKGVESAQEEKLIESGDWDAIFAAHDLTAPQNYKVDQGRVHHFDGAAWHQLSLPGADVIKDALIEAPDRVWLVGTGGTVLVGGAAAGFRRVDLAGFSGTFLSITRWGDAYVLASDYALHTFDGRQLAPLKPRLRRTPNPFKVQGFGGTLLYFDYKQGVHRYDGTDWTPIPIPPELLKRKFTGLPRR